MTTSVSYEVHTGAQALEALAPAWMALQERTPTHVFQTCEHAQVWWECVGAHSRSKPVIVTATSDGVLVGLMALCVVYLGPLRLLTWLGGPHIMDYGDVVFDAQASPIDADEFVGEALRRAEAAARLGAPYFPTVRTDAIAFPYFSTHLTEVKRSEAPYVAAQPWEEFISKRSKRHRHEVKRYWRRLEEAGHCEIRQVTASDPMFEMVFQRVVELQKSRHCEPGAKSELYDPRHVVLRRCQIERMPGARLTAMFLDDTVIAASYDLTRGDRVYGIITTYDPDFSRLAPGRLLMDHMVCDAIEHGLLYDFCLGDEAYKRMWARTSEPLVTFVGRGPTGAVLAALIKRRVKARAHAEAPAATQESTPA